MTKHTIETLSLFNEKLDSLLEQNNFFPQFYFFCMGKNHETMSDYNTFLNAYCELSNISDETYRRQRAITAFYWIRERCKRLSCEMDVDEKQFIDVVKTRLVYDFNHPKPLAPTFFYSKLEGLATIADSNRFKLTMQLSVILSLLFCIHEFMNVLINNQS